MKEKRIEKIMEIIHKLSPDFVCLQEVRQDILEIIIKNKQKYHLCGVETMRKNGNSYDVLILSKWTPIKKERKNLKSNQGRNQLSCDFKIENKTLNINTSHIESIFGNNSGIKNDQIESILNKSAKNDYFVFLGDTNILETDINPNLPTHISDAFKAMNSSKDNEFSYNRFENENITNTYPPARFDRIYFNNNNFKIVKFKLLKDKIKNGNPPSDHFGVYCELETIAK